MGDSVEISKISAYQVDLPLRFFVVNVEPDSPSSGQIEVALEVHDYSAWLSVRDQGEGIDEDKLATLFLPFTGSATDRSSIGLGLAIVKQIVDLHDGEIEVHKRPGGGTEVTVKLALEDEPEPSAATV